MAQDRKELTNRFVDLTMQGERSEAIYSFQAANGRHEHEYWETIKLPEGKILIPGVITHASNIRGAPELIAKRIVRYARLAGRENVIAGADCGFSSQATYSPEIDSRVVWATFRAMAEGAKLATNQLGT